MKIGDQKVQRTLRKQKVRGLLQDKKVPGTNGDQGSCSPRPACVGPAAGLLGESRLMAPFTAKQGLSNTVRDLVA